MQVSILIIEDEPAIAEAISFALETDGYQTDWRTTGEESLILVQHKIFDLIIMDVGLPDINGFELFKKIIPNWSLPVIFLTARTEEIDRVVGLELGADDYIAKPFSPRELCARVRTILRRVSRGNHSVQHSVSNLSLTENVPLFQINDEKKTIYFYGQALDLSRTEYRLLKVLIERPGRVFSREELMERAWEHPDVSLDRTVDAHIKLLRNKLKLIDSSLEQIVTHRGLGYALKEF